MRLILFVALFVVLATAAGWIAIRAGALLGALLDAQFTAPKGQLDFKLLYESRLHGWMVWGSDLGVVADNLPTFAWYFAISAVFALLLRRLYRRPLKTWITASASFRWRLFWAGLILFGVVYSAGLALQGTLAPAGYKPALGWLRGEPWNVAIFLVAMFFMVSFMAAAEEFLFRGWLLKELTAFVPNYYFVFLVSSAAFALAHRQFEFYRMAQLFLGGIALAWAAARLEGLEFGIGLHTAWNMSFALVGQDRSVKIDWHPGERFLPKMMGSPLSAAEWAVLIALSLAALALVELVFRWRLLRSLLRLDAQ